MGEARRKRLAGYEPDYSKPKEPLHDPHITNAELQRQAMIFLEEKFFGPLRRVSKKMSMED